MPSRESDAGLRSITSKWLPLVDITAGHSVTIRRIHELGENSPELLKYLEENDLIPGSRVEVLRVLPFNQSYILESQRPYRFAGFYDCQVYFCGAIKTESNRYCILKF